MSASQTVTNRAMRHIGLILVLLSSGWNSAAAADNLTRMEWKVDGVSREALVYAPAAAKTTPSPVVFAFHGHGGTMKYAAAKFAYHKHWPEAIVVYMQGTEHAGGFDRPRGQETRLAEDLRRPERPRPEVLRRRAGDPQEGLQGR